jgi:hypothetical protein
MRALLALLGVLLLPGCLAPLHMSRAREVAAKQLGCPPARVGVRQNRAGPLEWIALGCGAELACDYRGGHMACFPMPIAMRHLVEPPPSLVLAVTTVAVETGCASGEAGITMRSEDVLGSIDICGRNFVCIDGRCLETAASKARVRLLEEAEEERKLMALVVDRIALETRCPRESVRVVEKAEWTRGTERAFRLEACGKQYVCSTAAGLGGGRTDCRAALEQAQPTAAPAL